MKVTFYVASFFTLVLVGLLFIPIQINEEGGVFAFLGNFHPLLLHVPIGTLIVLAVLEIVDYFKPELKINNASSIVLWFSVLSIIPTVYLGFFLAASGGYNPEKLFLHKWLGWGTALLSIWLAVYHSWVQEKSKNFKLSYKVLVILVVTLLSVAGHYGGSLTHGSDYLTKDMPVVMKNFFGVKKTESEIILSQIKEQAKDTINHRALAFANKVHPIMEANCFECHNADKQKGDIRLDNINWKVNTPEDVEKWQTILEEVSEGNMPPEEEEPLTTEERNGLLSWIEQTLKKPEVLDSIINKIPKKQIAMAMPITNVSNLSPEASEYVNNIRPILNKYCFSCHGAKKQKGSMRLDVLNWDMVNGNDAQKWHSALDEINAGEMPPKKKKQLTDNERRMLVDWLTNSLEEAANAKRGKNKKVTRRLTKSQYTNSLKHLLKLPVNFGSVLPDDGKSKMGFTNNGDVLQVSSLHIDYYQKIAREALDKAIVYGEKPTPKKYKVTFAENIGVDGIAAEFGGFQSAPIKKDNFLVEVLSKDIKASIDTIKRNIGVGMRGSMSDRYEITKNGMVLYSALPHKDVPPRSWQGPSPNLKMLIKNNFPKDGPFIFRVQASKGPVIENKEGLISLRKNVPAKVLPETIIIKAKEATKQHRAVLKDNKWLLADAVDSYVNIELNVNIPKEGFYQVDFVHPYSSEENMPSFLMEIGRFKRIQERLKLDKSLETKEEIVTPVTLGFFKKGNYKYKLGGKFFVGFSELRITPLADNDPLPEKLRKEADVNRQKFKDAHPSIRAFVGSRTDDGLDYNTYDVSKTVTTNIGDFSTYEFKGRLENLPMPVYNPTEKSELASTMIVGLWNNNLVKNKGETGPPLLVKSIELEVPYYPVWPPECHTNIFFDSPNINNKEIYTAEVLKKFIEKAFRRPLLEGELERYLNFWKDTKDNFTTYEDGVKEVLVAILCSPNFLYLLETEKAKPEKISDDYYLASKMSYFLWNSPPDAKLISLAEQGKLKEELSNELPRMVENPKIWKMIKAFTYDWLRIDRLKGMSANMSLYPDFTRFVKEDMAQETYSFVHHILEDNLSILNFVDSDFAMLNQNLAEFYGVKGIKGNEFRVVALPTKENRGGLLSQGAFLTGHSDGVQAHPIKRAVWLKEKILGDPSPPPPPNVPELDPETPGFDKLTLKEQLDLHRNKASCIDCHLKIDPYGVAFENYDAVGRYQEKAKDRFIDSKSTLPDGTQVNGVQGIKKYILNQKKTEFTKSLVEHLYAYGLGRDVGFSDEKEINNIVQNVIKEDYKFQSVLEQIILSDSFINN
ncbi:putative membrane protein [Maribacter vaceletii]|uniref:Putative membrane protein n=1 Tax=Maribacter vaceletii TaxID=1206816 RepID=A0A495E5I1_9FLAO|nr:DUF1592 domain-containing protein [Maribacter vaceletii]RKR12170.1 putative membrane protein [Maribacter vaceletii]